ncbi:hypothetical protein B0T24DRAFT_668936 [Lasiosphaeria ovina]|uniref:Heterokaryon incompatibility protein n=1 Tax=Lasiosphaeria ovina TaxID=92902 RepID=A0AAE0K3V7_9PEZI|nr:hypothetical protein B0T24DRAFT_668936 [Lasiosphaeria ovina]
MADVFANTTLTIAATSSANCDEGFLSDDEPTRISIRGVTASGQVFHVLAGPNIQLRAMYPLPVESAPTTVKAEWPLLSRGWVLQERLLSPRTLHMTAREIMWECGRRTKSQSHGSVIFYDLQRPFPPPPPEPNHSELSPLWVAWYEVITEYSRLDLSVPSDKLPAISGVAKRMAAARPGVQYLAGLWEDSLVCDLWYLDMYAWDPEKEKRLSKGSPVIQDRAPSWSWASRDMYLRFAGLEEYANGFEPLIEILGIECEPGTTDPTGSVLAGSSLTAKGQAIDVEIDTTAMTYQRVGL